jgi:S-adenosyl-L-methionine hydrolase (adenosine-forming)
MPSAHPIVTLTTDFGLADSYVAEMKAAILRHCPTAILVDITHLIPRHDILAGSIALERAVAAFDHAIHLAVIDPGVGTDRRALLVRVGKHMIVCPDNGLITWPWRRRAPATAFELTWQPPGISHTFHGRDWLGPAAGRLAAGESMVSMCRPISAPVLLSVKPAEHLAEAEIIHIDHFGNATTNVPAELVDLIPLQHTYAEVPIGHQVRLIGSSGLLEIAVREGSAAQILNLKVGDKVTFP